MVDSAVTPTITTVLWFDGDEDGVYANNFAILPIQVLKSYLRQITQAQFLNFLYEKSTE